MKFINYFGTNPTTIYNLYIGGVSSVITNATQLASYFSFSSGNVTEFTTDGDNIKAYINTTYTLNNNAFDNSGGAFDWGNGALLTYFYDADNLMTNMSTGNGSQFYNQYNLKWIIANACTTISSGCFRNCYSLQKVEFNACTTVSTSFNFNGCYNLRYISIPSCTTLGSNVTADNMFTSVQFFIRCITNTTLSTNNAGSPDGDLQYITGTAGGTVYYRANTTAPSAISDLTVGTKYGTALQLNFTPPSSTNTILYYEAWVNGVFRGLLTGSGKEVTGLSLNTSYNITVKTVDIYGNKSTSNTLATTTNASYVIPTGDIVSYWPLNSNSNDSVGSNNGSDTSVSYVSGGVVGNCASFTAGNTSVVTVADAANLSYISTPFSFSFWFKFNTNDSAHILTKRNNTTNREYGIFMNTINHGINFYMFDQSTGANIQQKIPIYTVAGVWYHFSCSHDGSDTTDGITVSINAEMNQFNNNLTGGYIAMENLTEPLTFGKLSYSTASALDGFMDEIYLFDVALTRGNMSDIYAKNLGGSAL